MKTKTTAPKGALTHREAANHFPILRTIAAGFEKDGRIIKPDEFQACARMSGGGATECARFALNLAGFSNIGDTSIWRLLNVIDSAHKRAAVRLFKAVAERGIK